MGSKVLTIQRKHGLSATLNGPRSFAINIPIDFVHSKALGLFEFNFA